MKRKKTKQRSTQPSCTITMTSADGHKTRFRGKPLSIVTRDSVRDIEDWSQPYMIRAIAEPSEVVITFERGSLKCRTSA